MTDRPYRVLFLCTHNSARSVMAEAILNAIGPPSFKGYSAGSHPRGSINRYVLDLLERSGHPTGKLASKSWDAFTGRDAPALDFVFTLCDQAAGEICPVFPGHPLTAHWPFPDPSKADGTEAEIRAFVSDVYRQIHTRLSLFTSLPLVSLDRMSLQRRVRELGSAEGSGETA
ncbi:Protein-tyrosine-phosphatase [Limimonas halophila]|uniref:Protein-tyrosine-phosphatase n=1 Tax=Limimonas halophila TaxID=1082479 RepID=A0A1G7ME02_9PROT|nr:arsenate reductase ArsC [Limimonas halophila]SDF59794.1 Protein-tyrosine-phosphatase [Limimonas halophila]